MDYIKVKDKNYLERDPENNAIVNTDIESYNTYIQNYYSTYYSKQKIKCIENDINSLKENVSEIKKLLLNIFENSKTIN